MTRSYNNNDKDKNNPSSEFSDTDFKNVQRSNLSIPIKNKTVSNKIITPFKFIPVSSTNSNQNPNPIAPADPPQTSPTEIKDTEAPIPFAMLLRQNAQRYLNLGNNAMVIS